jgi:hypothetical protein
MSFIMRSLLSISMFVLVSLTFADWFVTSPRAVPIYTNEIRYDALGARGVGSWHRVGYGLGMGISIAGTHQAGIGSSFDVTYNYMVPFMDISPGISVGLLDGADRTVRGRALFLAITHKYGNFGDYNQDIPTEFTFGFWSGRGSKLFGSALFPWTEQIAAIFEWSGETPNAGVEITALKGVRFRAISVQQGLQFGLTVRLQF